MKGREKSKGPKKKDAHGVVTGGLTIASHDV